MMMHLQGRQLGELLPTLLQDAGFRLRLTMYQLAPKTTGMHKRMALVWQQLDAAPRRGLQCSALLYSGGQNALMAAATITAAEQLRAAGWRVRIYHGAKIMHAKQLVVDSRQMVIGSHNWTTSGLVQNHEASLLVEDDAAIDCAAAWHDELMAEG